MPTTGCIQCTRRGLLGVCSRVCPDRTANCKVQGLQRWLRRLYQGPGVHNVHSRLAVGQIGSVQIRQVSSSDLE
jgi:hypothetical protein